MRTITFQDHHIFSESDIDKIISQFHQTNNPNKIVITTEKDIPRLECAPKNIISLLPIFVAPIEVQFLFNEDQFYSIIKSYVRKS
jgi:tetraacyldisaccharide 4'-kinase